MKALFPLYGVGLNDSSITKVSIRGQHYRAQSEAPVDDVLVMMTIIMLQENPRMQHDN